MDFKANKAIYLQIADAICEQILLKTIKANDRIPSVREMAVDMEVNPNTVLRTFNYLQDRNVIYNKRGLGYFVSETGYSEIINHKKQQFVNSDLPRLFKTMDLLSISIDEIKSHYQVYQKNNGDSHETHE